MIVIQSASHPGAVRNALADMMAADVLDVRVASAYVTVGGSELLLGSLEQALGTATFQAVPKLIVSALDFGLTEPAALELWRNLPNAAVRVSGAAQLALGSLQPLRAFHPKLYAFGKPDDLCNAFVGSANLTTRGLSANTEAGWAEIGVARTTMDVAFALVSSGTSELTDELLAAYTTLRHAQPPPPQVELEVQPLPQPPTPVAVANLQSFRSALENGDVDPSGFSAMWIQGEGFQGGSGNQLELPRGGHRFFGFAFNNYNFPDNTTIGIPSLRSGAKVWNDRRLTWHGNNGMERMNLPTAAQGGYNYANMAVLFRRLPTGQFELVVADWNSDLAKSWREASAASSQLYRLGSAASNRVVGFL